MVSRRIVPLAGLTIATLLALAPAGHASDYLRGAYSGQAEAKSGGVDWAGVYGGVHTGYSSGKTDFSEIGQTLGKGLLPNTAISDQLPGMLHLGQTRTQGASYGAFVGINYLWDDVVLGFEADYTRSSIKANSNSGPLSRTLTASATGTDEWDTTVGGNAQSTISDWGTLRARAGWAAGYWMPFVTAGLAFGNITSQANGSASTLVYTIDAGPPITRTLSGGDGNNNTVKHRGISYGGVIGAGVDVAFFSNFFVRAEWQYLQFASGGNRPEISINTARVAGALKF